MNIKIRKTLIAILMAMVLAIAVIPSLPAAGALAEEHQYTFTLIDKPGAYSTNAMGINARGDIVGVYDNPDAIQKWRGYLLTNGIFTEIDYPGATWTQPLGIGQTGDIVGYYGDNTGTFGFIRTKEGVYSKLGYALALAGILPNGTLIGVTKTFNPVMISGTTNTTRADIFCCHYGATPNGKQLVGGTLSGRSYLIDNGTAIIFDVFGSIYSAARGISPSGNTIVGTYKHTASTDYFEGHGFIAERKGLKIEDWDFTEVVYPDETVVATRLFGINAGGDLVGAYNHSDGLWHGFVALCIDE